MKFIVNLILLSIVGCSNVQPSIIELSFLAAVDTARLNNMETVSFSKYYVVENYNDNIEDDKFIASYVDSVILQNKDSNDRMNLFIYKHSSITNIEHLQNTPRDIFRHSQDHDMIYVFHWYKKSGKLDRRKYKNGKQVEPLPSDIKVEDVH